MLCEMHSNSANSRPARPAPRPEVEGRDSTEISSSLLRSSRPVAMVTSAADQTWQPAVLEARAERGPPPTFQRSDDVLPVSAALILHMFRMQYKQSEFADRIFFPPDGGSPPKLFSLRFPCCLFSMPRPRSLGPVIYSLRSAHV